MQVINKKIIVIFICLSIFIFGLFKLFNNEKIELDDVRLDIKNNNNSFAIYIEDGEGGYKEQTDSSVFPFDNYVFNEELSGCIDIYGNDVKDVLSYEKDIGISVNTNKTLYCYLYFDEKKPEITNANKVCDMGTSMSIEFTTSEPVTEYYYSTNGQNFTQSTDNLYSLQDLTAGGTQKVYVYAKTASGKQTVTKEYSFTTKQIENTITASQLKASNPKDLSTTTQGGMFRYQGTDNVNNWIIFGEECTNEYPKMSEEEKIDKYMYRIIGITDNGELKLIKETFVKEDNVATFQWNDKYLATETDCGLNGEKCTWPDSMIFKRLNGISKGSIKGTEGDSDIFIGNSYYEYLSNTSWLNKIEEKIWKYGDISYGIHNGDDAYKLEDAFTTAKEPAKIGLMYMHDYAYAYKTNDSDAGNPQNGTNASKAWIFRGKDGLNVSPTFEWFLTRYGTHNGSGGKYVPGMGIATEGGISNNNVKNAYLGVRPVFYLKSDVKITFGNGTKTTPFIIS